MKMDSHEFHHETCAVGAESDKNISVKMPTSLKTIMVISCLSIFLVLSLSGYLFYLGWMAETGNLSVFEKDYLGVFTEDPESITRSDIARHFGGGLALLALLLPLAYLVFIPLRLRAMVIVTLTIDMVLATSEPGLSGVRIIAYWFLIFRPAASEYFRKGRKKNREKLPPAALRDGKETWPQTPAGSEPLKAVRLDNHRDLKPPAGINNVVHYLNGRVCVSQEGS